MSDESDNGLNLFISCGPKCRRTMRWAEREGPPSAAGGRDDNAHFWLEDNMKPAGQTHEFA